MADLSEEPRLYVIGDIHGRLDLLDRLIAVIRDDAGARGADSLTVTVGDYIDRGPDPRGVVERLMGNPFPGRYVALKGNHEALLLNFLVDPSVGRHWRHLGGLETLRSFGVSVSMSWGRQNFVHAAEDLRAVLTPAHMIFFRSLQPSLTVGRYLICHAGVRPGIPLEQQSEDDLLWIRDTFLASTADFGKIVVHGHTPTPQPEVKPNRINVDTGAFLNGRLTCAVLENGQVRFLST
jgi:Calcineurin-like phosphoesterase